MKNVTQIDDSTTLGVSIEISDINKAAAAAAVWINKIKVNVIQDTKGFGKNHGQLTDKDIKRNSFSFEIQDIFNIQFREGTLTVRAHKSRAGEELLEKFRNIL